MSKRKLNVGIIGAGFIGQIAHLMNYIEINECRVIAIAEMRPQLRERVMARYGIPRGYSSHRELLNDQSIEAVVVVVPRPHIARIVHDCLNAGKHVFSEKPMAGNSDQARMLIALAKEKQLNYVVGYMKRYDDGVRMTKKLFDEAIKSGDMGSVLFARANCYMGNSYCNAGGHIVTDEQPIYEDDEWPMVPSWLPNNMHKSFAAFANTFIHDVNLLRFLFAEDFPRIEYANFDPDVGQLVVMKFGNVKVSLETGKQSNRHWEESIDIFFEHGRLNLKLPPALLRNVPATVELYNAGNKQELIQPKIDWTWSFKNQASAFISDVLLNQRSINCCDEGLIDILIIEEMWKLYIERLQ